MAAAFGDGSAKFCKLESADMGIERTAKPNAEEEPMIGKARGDVARSAHNAGANGIANSHSNTKADAQDLQELAAVLAEMD